MSSRNKQIEKLKKQADRIESFLKENGPKIGKQGREIQSNLTDNESCKMFSSHGAIQGYNVAKQGNIYTYFDSCKALREGS